MALDRFTAWGDRLEPTHEIPPKLPAAAPSDRNVPTHLAEARILLTWVRPLWWLSPAGRVKGD